MPDDNTQLQVGGVIAQDLFLNFGSTDLHLYALGTGTRCLTNNGGTYTQTHTELGFADPNLPLSQNTFRLTGSEFFFGNNPGCLKVNHK
jgi:hypothetical protein